MQGQLSMAQHLQLDCSRHVLLCRVSVPHLRHHGTSARARTARRTAEWVRLDSSCCTCRAVRVGAAAAESTASGELPAELQKIVTTFSMVPDAKIKYQQLLFYGKKLPPFPASEHTDDNKVRGCVSQVWIALELKDGKVYWRADSDSLLTKGLAALLVQGLSGCSPADIVRIQPDFIQQLGLSQALTPSRSNGFLNIFQLMQAKSLRLLSQAAA